MKVYGIDFTSAPSARKPLVCVACSLDAATLRVDAIHRMTDFGMLERSLKAPGPWIAGFDFPFGQPERLIANLDWPRTWERYVGRVARMSRGDWERLLTEYRSGRASGDRHHLR